MKRAFSCLLAAALTVGLTTLPACAADGGFRDVPTGSALAAEVQKAVDYGLMGGYDADTFGYADPMTRAQFVTVLDRMLGWSAVQEEKRMIPDGLEVPASGEDALPEAYLFAIGQAVWRDVVDAGAPFRPNDAVTRGEMSELLVRALGLKAAAEAAEQGSSPFTDVTDRKGYILIAREIGMANGTSATTFSPDAKATRAQAAAMLVRVYEKLQRDVDFVHGFYAISSHSQLDLGTEMDAVSAGWARMTWDGAAAKLQTDREGGNEYAVPDGWQEVTDALADNGVPMNLSVFMSGQGLKDLLASESGREEAAGEIMTALAGDIPYGGVTVDFEGLRKGDRENFTAFLETLAGNLGLSSVKPYALYVCVPPVMDTGAYYDGYDYAAIGALADKVILMAYDYDAPDLSQFVGSAYYKTDATSPLGQIYATISAAVEEIDPTKLLLGFSCKNMAWQIDGDGKLVSGTPVYPSNETVVKRLVQNDTELGWSSEYQQSYAVYTTEDGGRYFLWYQDGRSVEAALDAAKLLGVSGVSLWRIGNIPRDTVGGRTWNWDALLK